MDQNSTSLMKQGATVDFFAPAVQKHPIPDNNLDNTQTPQSNSTPSTRFRAPPAIRKEDVTEIDQPSNDFFKPVSESKSVSQVESVCEAKPEPEIKPESKPEVKAAEPEPEVKAAEPEPEVNVESEPEVKVIESEPEVKVAESEPEVKVAESEPDDEVPPAPCVAKSLPPPLPPPLPACMLDSNDAISASTSTRTSMSSTNPPPTRSGVLPPPPPPPAHAIMARISLSQQTGKPLPDVINSGALNVIVNVTPGLPTVENIPPSIPASPTAADGANKFYENASISSSSSSVSSPTTVPTTASTISTSDSRKQSSFNNPLSVEAVVEEQDDNDSINDSINDSQQRSIENSKKAVSPTGRTSSTSFGFSSINGSNTSPAQTSFNASLPVTNTMGRGTVRGRGRISGNTNSQSTVSSLNSMHNNDINRRNPSPQRQQAMHDEADLFSLEYENTTTTSTTEFQPRSLSVPTRNIDATFSIPRAAAPLAALANSIEETPAVKSALAAHAANPNDTSTTIPETDPSFIYSLPTTSIEEAKTDSDRILRMLRAQANAARIVIDRQARDGTSITAPLSLGESELYNPAFQIPTFFRSPPAKTMPDSLVRNPNHVFLIGPVSYASERKKQWKPRWGILYRDRLELYNKACDPQPRLAVSLEGMHVSLVADASCVGGYSVSLAKSKQERIFLRGDHITTYQPCGLTMGPNPLNVPVPDAITLQRAWSIAIRMRVENLEYIKKTKLQNSVADERLLSHFDLQVRAPTVRHMNEFYAPISIIPHIATYRTENVVLAPLHWSIPISGLRLEVTSLDLCGGSMSIDAASFLAKLFSDPDCVPTVALRTGGIHMEVMHLDVFLTAITKHPAAPLVELNFVYIDGMAEDKLDFFTRLFTESNLPQLRNLSLRDSNLDDTFCTTLAKKIRAKVKNDIGAILRLQTFDISMNEISDIGAIALIDLFAESVTLTSDLQAISFAQNPVSDGTAARISKWIHMQRPSPGEKSAIFTHRIGRTIALQHISLAYSNVSTKGARIFSDAACWSLTLRTLDLSGCPAITEEGIAAVSHLAQINESLERLHVGTYRLGVQGLTAMRLIYRFAVADPELFTENDKTRSHLTNTALACEYTSLQQ